MDEIIREKLEDQIMEVLKGLDDSEMVNLWNEYCDRNNYYDDRIYYMEEIDEIMNGQDVTYILNRAFFGHDQWSEESSFNPNRDYFTFNGYGNLISMDAIGYNEYANKFMCDYIDEDAIVNYILDNMDSLECDEITEILDDYENGIN